MERETIYKKESDLFSAERNKNFVTIRFKKNFLFNIINLKIRDSLLNYLDLISLDDSIRALLVISPSDKQGVGEFIEFYRQVLSSELGLIEIHRMYNAIDQFILKTVGLNKIVVHATCGKVISLFLNMSLACDYRIAADNTVFYNPYIELGIVPKGGGAFFLPGIIGKRKAYEVLLSDKKINADEALDLGIIDMIVPLEKLEESAFAVANRFADKPINTLAGVKKLLNHSMDDLKTNLELENEENYKIFSNPDFWKNLAKHHVSP